MATRIKAVGLLLLNVAWVCAQPCFAAEPAKDRPIADTVALEMEAAALGAILTNQLHMVDREIELQKHSAAEGHPSVWTAAAFALAAMLTLGLLAPRVAAWFNRRCDPWAAKSASPDALAEQQAFSDFAEKFAAGPALSPRVSVAGGSANHSRPAVNAARPADPVDEFRRSVPKELLALGNAFSALSNAGDSGARERLLADFCRQVAALKAKAQSPALLPFWQISSALEGLLDQLARKPQELNPSALRTVAAALDLLKALCLPGLKPTIASEPPVRILAVDDDPICRYAISFALKKVLSAPDVVGDGPAALALAGQLPYDVVFLDIEMPGMDGFELCSRIHASESNHATPVVFVTRHTDFGSRAKSSLSGGRDLIGKPFLTFEVALKALTMVVQRRLQADACERLGLAKVDPQPAGVTRASQKGFLAPAATPGVGLGRA